jgi:hypothetical protein
MQIVELTAPRATLRSALDGVVALVGRYVVISEAAAHALALWAAHTHMFEAAETTPYIQVTSAVKRSGKSRVLEVAEVIVARPWLTARVTAAVLPRRIDAECPTLLLDESDAAFKSDREYSETLRGILNSGWRRGGKTSVCVGQAPNFTTRDFSTFSPKMIAGIGKLPDTIADRCITIEMSRRSAAEARAMPRFKRRKVAAEAEPLRQWLVTWSANEASSLSDREPSIPDELDDRAAEIWEPLLAIADLAGGDWPGRARNAAVELSGAKGREEEDLSIRLLADICLAFQAGQADEIPTQDLLDALNADEAKPWGDVVRGRPLDSRRLARLLKPFDIRPRNLRVGDRVLKGYSRSDFTVAWQRYLPPTPPDPGNAASTATSATPSSPRLLPSSGGAVSDPVLSRSGEADRAANPEGYRERF